MREGFIYPMAAPDIPVNLLVNSCFLPKYRINQRGLTSYEGMGIYTIDRWQVWLNSVDVVHGGVRTSQMYQLLAGLDLSKTYTFAVCDTEGSVTAVSGVFGEGPETINGTTKVRLSILDGYAEVVVENAEKGRTYIWAALYEGTYTADTLPLYIPKGYAAELAECQRYYRRYSQLIGTIFYPRALMLPITVEYMRIAPTVTVQEVTLPGSTANVYNGGGGVAGYVWLSLTEGTTVGTGYYVKDVQLLADL